jgi:L,D-transpeptidase YcbB
MRQRSRSGLSRSQVTPECGDIKVRQSDEQTGVGKVNVKRVSRGLSIRSAAIAAICAGSLFAGHQVHAQQQVAAVDDWMKFDGGSSSDNWDPGFDRSFARQWETQPARGFPTISPSNLDNMKASIKRYADVVARGGWANLPLVDLRVGKTHPAVAALRQRLKAEGDLTEDSGYPETFDSYVEKGVKAAQERNGLPPTGVVDKATVMALNVPASARLRQLRTNLVRIQTLAAPTKGKYIIVNVPAAQIEAVENDKVVSRHAGVVGKVDRPTPLLQSQIVEVNFNKEWILPPTVIKEDLVPKARNGAKGYEVFKKYGVDIYQDYNAYAKHQPLDPATVNWSSPTANNLFFAQKPGEDNPLGFLKINFWNPYSVYMHDTPSKSIFSRNFRAESSGCVRVQNIPQLASWILADEGWNLQRVNEMKQKGETLNVQVKTKIKLYFAYVTAWATPDGAAHFRRDLYNHDGVGVTATAY